jgi:hypothetical protein
MAPERARPRSLGSDGALREADTDGEEVNGPGVVIAAEQREYALAVTAWFQSQVRHLMRASDPLYASLSREPVEAMPDEFIQPTGDDEPMIVTPVRIEAQGEVTVSGAVDGDLDEMHTAVAVVAEQMLRQTMEMFFSQLTAVTERVGNTVDAQGDVIEGFIRMIEKMDVAFDENGLPNLQMVMNPADVDRLKEQTKNMTEDQVRRLENVLRAKKEKFDASRRRRRLPRHGH